MTTLTSLASLHDITLVTIQALADIALSHPVIDCRALPHFVESHLIGSTSIDAQELFDRMHELPQRDVSLALYGDETSLIKAIQFLTDKGYKIDQVARWPDDIERYKGSTRLDLLSGEKSKQLWAPAKIIQHFIDNYLDDLNALKTSNLKGLDIACGSGRDMISLAQNGVEMTGIDYHSDALKRARRLAKSNQVDIQTLKLDLEASKLDLETPKLDLNAAETPLRCFDADSFHIVSVLRYLHRPLLSQLDRLIAPGGFIVYQTFMEVCEKISSPKNPRFLLKPNELNSVFSSYHIYRDEIETLKDGRPVSAFIAQKPSGDSK